MGKRWPAILMLAVASAFAQNQPTVGSLLVASRDLRDPNFAGTVVLVVTYNEDGALGLILNRRSDQRIARVFREWKEAAGHNDPVFEGGPVEEDSILALVRLASPPRSGKRVATGVYVTSDDQTLLGQLNAKSGPERFRVFLGYAGWGPRQLEREIDLGGWHVLRPRPALIFDASPETLWQRLVHEMEVQVAFWRGLQRPGRRGVLTGVSNRTSANALPRRSVVR